MAYPTTKVEISFVSGPYVASPTWVDVTTYVREVTTRRGRSDEFQNFEAGTATVILDNRDRRFDPMNTAGPYYGYLTPRRQIRISATANGTTANIYRGYVSGWPVEMTDAGFDSTVALECFDALGLLAQEELPDDLADKYIRQLNPRHYWPLTDPIDVNTYTSQTLQDYGSSPQPLTATAGVRTSNAGGLASGIPDISVGLSETQYTPGWSFTTAKYPTTSMSEFSCWFLLASGDINYIFATYAIEHKVELIYNKASSLLQVATYSGLDKRVYSATVYLDVTQPHHIAVATNAGSQLSFVILDGSFVGLSLLSLTANTTTSNETYAVTPGRHQQAILSLSSIGFTGFQTIYSLSQSYKLETVFERFYRLVGYTSFPSALASTSGTFANSVSEITTGGPDVASELQLLADSEGGNLFVSKDGIVTLTSRYAFSTGTSITSQATFGGAGITIGTDIGYSIDDSTMRNNLTMGLSGDATVEVEDATSIAAYGLQGGSWPTQLASQTDAQTLGTLLVNFSKDPKLVISPIEINVAGDIASWATILGLELLQRITLNIVPRIGATITTPQLIQSIEHRITPSQWSTTINGSVRYTNVFIIGSSLIGGPDLIA